MWTTVALKLTSEWQTKMNAQSFIPGIDTAAFHLHCYFWIYILRPISTSLGALRVYCCLFMSSTSPSPFGSRSGRWAEIWPLVSSLLFAFLNRQNSPSTVSFPFCPSCTFFWKETHACQSFSSPREWRGVASAHTRAFREVKQPPSQKRYWKWAFRGPKSSWLL